MANLVTRPAMNWGLLGPAVLGPERRTRTLNLGAAVRRFNEAAVPGLGGVWFIRQALLATLGVRVAQMSRARGTRVSNIECANALEALGCMLAFRERGWISDARLRGSTKLPREHPLDFASMRKPGFYVTQPMRMGTVQALAPLGLVTGTGSRFNAFETAGPGDDLIDAAVEGLRPYNRGLVDHLVQWASNGETRMDTRAVLDGISPCAELPDSARRLFMDRLTRGAPTEPDKDRQRRRRALDWVENLRKRKAPLKLDWLHQPPSITDASHWSDLRAGAGLFAAQDAAIDVLDALEEQLARTPRERLPLSATLGARVVTALTVLRTTAQAYLSLEHADEDAGKFCRECTADAQQAVIASLVARDGRVLRCVGTEIRPAVAFRRQGPTKAPAPQELLEARASQTAATPVATDLHWPENISYRLNNLYLLNLDLHGELDAHLGSLAPEGTSI